MAIKNVVYEIIKNRVLFFFILIFVIGVSAFQDYGLGWDDEWSRIDTGYNNFNYVFNGDKTITNNNEKYHGPFVEMLLVSAEKIFNITDISEIFTLRHIILFIIFFVSIIAFYSIANSILGANYAILACLMLFISPRIFAESFYNSKDIAFLSFFNFAVFSYFSFLKNQNIKWALIHALFSAILIDVRILGIIITLLTIGFYGLNFFFKEYKTKSFLPLIIYLSGTLIFTILFWPILWEGPWFHFVNAFNEMKKYHWDAHVYFNGNSIHASQIPWYYLPMWIFITTPFIYSILWLLGLFFYIKSIFYKPLISTLKEYKMLSIFILLILPVFSVIALKSVVYDGWRHLYFIYPFFIIISVYGIKESINWLKAYKHGSKIFLSVIFINIGFVAFWMIKNHPHQNVYFNNFSQKMLDAGGKFELDYWGLSYRQGLEYLLKSDIKTLPIIYSSTNFPGKLNQDILPADQRSKLKYVEPSDSTWVYFLTNYRGMGAPENTDLIHQIKVDDINIMGIYKIKPKI